MALVPAKPCRVTPRGAEEHLPGTYRWLPGHRGATLSASRGAPVDGPSQKRARLPSAPAAAAEAALRGPRVCGRYSSSGAQARSSPFFKGAAACGLQRVTATWLLWGFQ